MSHTESLFHPALHTFPSLRADRGSLKSHPVPTVICGAAGKREKSGRIAGVPAESTGERHDADDRRRRSLFGDFAEKGS